MKIGDLVIMPGSCYRNGTPASPATGIVLKAQPVLAGTGTPRVQVYWIEDAEASWEPREWIEVISAAD